MHCSITLVYFGLFVHYPKVEGGPGIRKLKDEKFDIDENEVNANPLEGEDKSKSLKSMSNLDLPRENDCNEEENDDNSATSVNCPELGDRKPFKLFRNIDRNTQCWSNNKPSFNLYMGTSFKTIANKEHHLKSLSPNLYSRNSPNITRLVVIIHGFENDAREGGWVHEMAQLVMKNDKTKNIGVLTVDWSEGADIDLGKRKKRGFLGNVLQSYVYNPSSANTRYVGVATERIVKQLNQEDDLYIHCIGHSLGAHTCGFFGNAIKEDESYKKTSLDRITALDPAGPNFYTDSARSPDPICSPKNEKLDKTDADYVDVIHTDSDHLGTDKSVGHADFYIGEGLDTLGSDQANCNSFVCDHSRSHEIFRFSISHPTECWAKWRCKTKSIGCQPSFTMKSSKIQFGYWWGKKPGKYGVILKKNTC